MSDIAAVVVLGGGMLARDFLLTAQASPPAPPSEGSALQQLSQDAHLRRLALLVADEQRAQLRIAEDTPLRRESAKQVLGNLQGHASKSGARVRTLAKAAELLGMGPNDAMAEVRQYGLTHNQT